MVARINHFGSNDRIMLFSLMKLIVWIALFAELSMSYTGFPTELATFTDGYAGQFSAQLNDSFVPSDADLVTQQWLARVNSVHSVVGTISPVETAGSARWQNKGAETPEELVGVAILFKAEFEALLQSASSRINSSFVIFGQNEQFIVRSLESLKDKVARRAGQGNENPIPFVADVLRGTIVVTKEADLKAMVSILAVLASSRGHRIVFDDKFHTKATALAGGYVGVHAKVLLNSNATAPKAILAEVQLHLSSIMDGTPQCPREYARPIYELIRAGNDTALEAHGYSAMQLGYLFGLQRLNSSSSSSSGGNGNGNRRAASTTSPGSDLSVNYRVIYLTYDGLLLMYNSTIATINSNTNNNTSSSSSSSSSPDSPLYGWSEQYKSWFPITENITFYLEFGFTISSNDAQSLMQNGFGSDSGSDPTTDDSRERLIVGLSIGFGVSALVVLGLLSMKKNIFPCTPTLYQSFSETELDTRAYGSP